MVSLQRHLLGEKCTGQNPIDRAKSGTKRSILVDSNGIPLSVYVDAANRHDMKLTKPTLQNVVVNKPKPTIKSNQNNTCVWIKAMTIQKYMNYWKILWLYDSYQIKKRRK